MSHAAYASLVFVLLISAVGCDDGSVHDADGDGDTDVDSDADADGDTDGLCATDDDCDDGAFCNGPERCAPGGPGADPRGCVGAAALPCAANESCDEIGDACAAVCDREICASDGDCDLGEYCRPDRRCDPGALDADSFGCVDGEPPCARGMACDEELDRCCTGSLSGCECRSDADCDDGVVCNGTERCDPLDPRARPPQGCVPGTPVACPDGTECTEPGGGCRDVPSAACHTDGECDDGLFCNGLERCYPDHPSADAFGCIRPYVICLFWTCDEVWDCCTPPSGGPADCTTDDINVCGMLTDADGDGETGPECGMTVSHAYFGDDCDDTDPTIGSTYDPDGDGRSGLGDLCFPYGYDCDEGDASRYVGNVEVCDSPRDMWHDEDCDPTTVGDRDDDGDGFVSNECCNEQTDGSLLCGDDCDDSRRDINPSQTELCNGIDDDCDGLVDEGVEVVLYRDHDGDGFGEPRCHHYGCPGAPGYTSTAGDCNDANAALRPGESTCGLDPTVMLTCTDGSWTELPCPSGSRCVMSPDGKGACRE